MKNQDRRDFLKVSAKYFAGASILLLIPKEAVGTQFTTKEHEKEDWMDRYYAYVIDTTKCIGCGNCVRACKRENGVLEPFFRTWVERYNVTDKNEVYVDSPNGGHDGFKPKKVVGKTVKSFFVPKMCNHCRNTPCTQVCPVHASYASPEGVILVDKKTCIGCGYCVQACPYGSRYIDPRTHTADKCTWCYHRITKGLLPACVLSCPTGARKFGDLKEQDSEIKKILDTERVAVLKQELHTEPFCFYIGYDNAIR